MSNNAAILTREGKGNVLDGVRFTLSAENRCLERRLMARVRELVARVNEVAGEAILYLSECASMWMLFGRPDEETADKLLLHGFTDAEDLARLVIRLEREIRTVGDAGPYRSGGRAVLAPTGKRG